MKTVSINVMNLCVPCENRCRYRTVPDQKQLMQMYGDPKGKKLYSIRDLYMHYQKRYIAEKNITLYDVNDERLCSSRRI